MKFSCVTFWAFVCICTPRLVSADIVTFDLGPSAGSIGSLFEAGSTSETINGVTLSFAVEPINGSFFGLASPDSSGVFTLGETGNARARVNVGEAVTFTVTSARALELQSLDLNGVGPASDAALDAAFVSVNGGGPIELRTGVSDFNGSTDVWTPNLAIASGSTFRISTNDELGLQGITFNVAAIPEPSSWAIISVIGLGTTIFRRRQSQKRANI